MKKFLLVITSVLLLGSIAANAQGLVVKGGLTFSNVGQLKDLKLSGRTGWEAGVGYQSGTSLGFSLQPELMYKVKGVTLSDATNVNLSYLELPVNVQWGVDLLIARPFVFAAPFIGYNLKNLNKFSSATSDIAKQVNETLNQFEYGLGLGIGVNIFKFQLTGKYNWNFGTIADNWGDAVNKIGKLDPAAGTIEIALGLRF